MKTLYVSLNELRALLKRAFEGMGYHVGVCEDAAEAMVWHLARGFPAVASLTDEVARLIESEPIYPEQLSESDDTTLIDGQMASCVTTGGLIVDLAYANARHFKTASVKVHNCFEPVMIMERLVNAADRGVECAAYWQNPSLNEVHLLTPCQDVAWAQYAYNSASASGDDSASLNIICSQVHGEIERRIARLLDDGVQLMQQVTFNALDRAYADAIERGVLMQLDLWNTLIQQGERVTVSASAASRAGAGP